MMYYIYILNAPFPEFDILLKFDTYVYFLQRSGVTAACPD